MSRVVPGSRFACIRLVALALLAFPCCGALAATITVTSVGDAIAVDGVVTLREAITSISNGASVNADVVPVGAYGTSDTINFAIPGSGVHTILPASALPQIAKPMLIDGYSQSGAAQNTSSTGFNGTLLIELSGTNAGNTTGLVLSAGNTTVRGLVINDFQGTGSGAGVAISLVFAGGNHIEGNFLGTDPTGTLARGNRQHGVGLEAGSNNNIVGGTVPAARNVISANAGAAFFLGTSGNTIQGNFVGTQKDGVSPLGNGTGIIMVTVGNANNNLIGGTVPAAGNVVAFNEIGVGSESAAGTGNAILGNSIFSSSGLGIDLLTSGGQGVTPNDPGDGDTGANNLQNFPVLTSATFAGGNVTIGGTLNSAVNATFRVEFFANATCHPSGHGEGRTFLGFKDVTTDGAGNASVSSPQFAFDVNQLVFTATATDAASNTSEFSQCIKLPVLDVDADNRYDALTDGLMIVRYLLGLTGTALTHGALGATATRVDPAEILLYLDSIKPALEIDGNLTTDAFTDGVLIVRYLFGLRGGSLVAGALGSNPTRTAPDIETYIQSLMP